MSGLESPGKTRVRRTLQVMGALLVAWMLASAVMLNAARSRAINGLDLLEQARGQIDGPSLLRGDGERVLSSALRDFEQAHDRASSPVLAPWSVVPLVGQNTRSVDALTKAAVKVARVGEEVARGPRRDPRRVGRIGLELCSGVMVEDLDEMLVVEDAEVTEAVMSPDDGSAQRCAERGRPMRKGLVRLHAHQGYEVRWPRLVGTRRPQSP